MSYFMVDSRTPVNNPGNLFTLNGLSFWTLLASDRKRVDTLEMWEKHRMLYIPRTVRTTNTFLLNNL